MNNSKIIKILFSFLLIFASLVLILGILRGDSSVFSYFDLSRTQKSLELRVDQLAQQNQALSKEIQKIQESSMYAKKILKDKYHKLDDNESLIFLPD